MFSDYYENVIENVDLRGKIQMKMKSANAASGLSEMLAGSRFVHVLLCTPLFELQWEP